jgi:hypothetical protein
MMYEGYSNADYWEFVPKEQKMELKKEGRLPKHVEKEEPKKHQISDSDSSSKIVLGKRPAAS